MNFLTSTLMSREQNKKVNQLVQGLYDSHDSIQFREPVDWKAYNLLDYPSIIKKPMDLSTVKENLAKNAYQTVQECLKDVYLIWQNCRTYNRDNQYYLKLADKLDKVTKKMIKNYLPFVTLENASAAQKKKAALLNQQQQQVLQLDQPVSNTPSHNNKKQMSSATTKKIAAKQAEQPKSYQDMKDNKLGNNQQSQLQEQTPFIKSRKAFLMLTPLCTSEQIGVIFMLINKNEPECIDYTQDNNPNINAEKMSDALVKRLTDQMDMWGVGYVSYKKR